MDASSIRRLVLARALSYAGIGQQEGPPGAASFRPRPWTLAEAEAHRFATDGVPDADADMRLRQFVRAIDRAPPSQRALLYTAKFHCSSVEYVVTMGGRPVAALAYTALRGINTEDCMGLIDDLAAMVRGQADFNDLAGFYEVGDRVAVKTDIWQNAVARHRPWTADPRGRTATVLACAELDDDGGFVVDLQTDAGADLRLDVLAVEGLDLYLARIKALPGPLPWLCNRCWETGYIGGYPAQGVCDCDTATDYKRDDESFAQRRRRNKR